MGETIVARPARILAGLSVVLVLAGWAPRSGVSLARVGQIGGEVRAVAADGNLVYMGVGRRLEILDVSNPSHPVVVGQTGLLPGRVVDVAVQGAHAFLVLEDYGLQIVNISDHITPRLLGAYSPMQEDLERTFEQVTSVAVDGHYAYLTGGFNGLQVIDVADPLQPRAVGAVTIGGFAEKVALRSGLAYVATAFMGLWIVDVTHPHQPRVVSSVSTAGLARDVELVGDVAFVAGAFPGGLEGFDLSDPRQPREIIFMPTELLAAAITASAGRIYLVTAAFDGDFGDPSTEPDGALRVYNVSDPHAPREVGFYDLPGNGIDVALAGGNAYVAAGASGLRVVDARQPDRLHETGAYEVPVPAKGVAVEGDRAYLATDSGFLIADVATPEQPRMIGAFDGRGEVVKLVAQWHYAYIAYQNDPVGRAGGHGTGLSIVDVATASGPREVGVYVTPVDVADLWVSDALVYLAAGPGIRIVDVADPSRPREVGAYRTPTLLNSIAVTHGLAFLVDIDGDLHIVDVSDPNAPRAVMTYEEGFAVDVAVSGTTADVTTLDEGVHVFDLTTPRQPHVVSRIRLTELPEFLSAAAAAGSYLYITSRRFEEASFAANAASPRGGFDNQGSPMLHVIDIADLGAPREVARYERLADAVVEGKTIYATDNSGAIAILRLIQGPRLFLPVAARLAVFKPQMAPEPTAEPGPEGR